MISARVAGVPKLCFSIFPNNVPSVNGFGGDVNSLLMVKFGATVMPFAIGQWIAAVRLLFSSQQQLLYFDERQMFLFKSDCNFCLFGLIWLSKQT